MTTPLARTGRLVAGLTLAALLAVGCSSPAATASPSSATPVPVTSAPAASPTSSASAAASAATTGATVNANTATQELGAAFTAAGIPNADRWAREVAEYRPYDADPTWAKLRQELAKYNIDPAVLDQIIATLTL